MTERSQPAQLPSKENNENLVAELEAAASKWVMEKNKYTLESLRDARAAVLRQMQPHAGETNERRPLLSDRADDLIRELHRQGLVTMQAIFDGALLRIQPDKPPLGQEPWRLYLPVITAQMLADYGQESFFEKTDKPVKGIAGINWSQAAVDFACMLQGQLQERHALKAPEQHKTLDEVGHGG